MLGVVANNKVSVYATLSARVILLQTQLQTPRRRVELLPRIQAHLVLVISKIIALLEYKAVLQYSDSLSLLSLIIQVALHAHS